MANKPNADSDIVQSTIMLSPQRNIMGNYLEDVRTSDDVPAALLEHAPVKMRTDFLRVMAGPMTTSTPQ